MTDSLIYQTANSLLQQLQQRQISSRALLEAQIARVEQCNPRLNAVIANDFGAARQRADAADAALARGETWGPLHGLPMTVKDTFEVVGMPTTSGSPRLKAHMARHNAVAVQKLLDAGAIIFGKTNVPLYGGDLQSFNKVYGTTHNPWDLSRTPGGSSGGAAAALAAGFTSLELGSDIGGSIRTPAHYCGVFGHKTTQGIVSLRGHIPGPPGAISEPDLVVAGPMARSAPDLQTLLSVLIGPSPSMAPAWQLALPAPPPKTLGEMRVLAWFDDPLCVIDQEMRGIYQALIQRLRAAGAQVDEGAPKGLPLAHFYERYLNLLGSVMGASHKPHERHLMYWTSPLFQRISKRFKLPPLFEHYLKGVGQSHIEWMRENEIRLRLLEKIRPVFEQYDVILTPITPTTAISHLQKPDMPLRQIQVNEEMRSYTEHLMWIAFATLLGLPATSAPVQRSQAGLPVNVQIIGAPYQDLLTIHFADLLSPITGGFVIPPGHFAVSSGHELR